MAEEQLLSNEQLLQSFLQEQAPGQAIARQEDRITALQAKINDLKSVQRGQNHTIEACQAVIESNAYPMLNPVITAFSDRMSQSSKQTARRIEKAQKKIRKTKKKIQTIKKKQQRSERFLAFLSSMLHPDSGKQEYVSGMKLLQEDSLLRAEKQLSKVSAKLISLQKKLTSGPLSLTKTIRIAARITKLKTKQEKLNNKIIQLKGLSDQLDKLTAAELTHDKIDEIRQTAVETAAKAVMTGSSTTDMISGQLETAESLLQQIAQLPEESETLSPSASIIHEEEDDMISETEAPAAQSEKTEEPPAEEKNAARAAKKISNADKATVAKLYDAGIDFQIVTAKDGRRSIVFDAFAEEKVRQALSETQVQGRKR